MDVDALKITLSILATLVVIAAMWLAVALEDRRP
jgi:hypothetical protein